MNPPGATPPPQFQVEPPPPMRSTKISHSLWFWPAVAIVAIAVAGRLFGTVGAALMLGECVAAALFVVAQLLDRPNRYKAPLLAVTLGGLIVLVLSASAGWTTGSARGPGPADFRGRTVTQDMVGNVKLAGALLAGARLDGLDLRGNSLAGASADGASLADTILGGVDLRGADLRGADLSRACLRGADLSGAMLNGANVQDADLDGATLPPNASKLWTGQPAPSGAKPKRC